jgi:hypothetical protein
MCGSHVRFITFHFFIQNANRSGAPIDATQRSPLGTMAKPTNKMTVADLRAELTKRNLDTKGACTLSSRLAPAWVRARRRSTYQRTQRTHAALERSTHTHTHHTQHTHAHAHAQPPKTHHSPCTRLAPATSALVQRTHSQHVHRTSFTIHTRTRNTHEQD